MRDSRLQGPAGFQIPIFRIPDFLGFQRKWIPVPSSRFLTPRAGFRIPKAGFRISRARFRIPRAGFRIPSSKFLIPKSRAPDSNVLIPDSQANVFVDSVLFGFQKM